MTSTSVVILSQLRLQAGLTFSPISPEPTKDQDRLKACSESLQSELPISSLKSPHLRKSTSHKAPPPWGSLAFSGLSTQAVAGDNLNNCLASACCQGGHLCSSTISSRSPFLWVCFLYQLHMSQPSIRKAETSAISDREGVKAEKWLRGCGRACAGA